MKEGWKEFENQPRKPTDQKLPEDTKYKEYDVNPYKKGQRRDKERVVIGEDGSAYYTKDHYTSFIQIFD